MRQIDLVSRQESLRALSRQDRSTSSTTHRIKVDISIVSTAPITMTAISRHKTIKPHQSHWTTAIIIVVVVLLIIVMIIVMIIAMITMIMIMIKVQQEGKSKYIFLHT